MCIVSLVDSGSTLHITTNYLLALPRGGLAILDEATPHTVSKHVHPETYEWHHKLGHLDFRSLAKLARKGFFTPRRPEPADFLQAKENGSYEECIKSK